MGLKTNGVLPKILKIFMTFLSRTLRLSASLGAQLLFKNTSAPVSFSALRGRNGANCNETRQYWIGMELPYDATDVVAKELLVRCFRRELLKAVEKR